MPANTVRAFAPKMAARKAAFPPLLCSMRGKYDTRDAASYSSVNRPCGRMRSAAIDLGPCNITLDARYRCLVDAALTRYESGSALRSGKPGGRTGPDATTGFDIATADSAEGIRGAGVLQYGWAEQKGSNMHETTATHVRLTPEQQAEYQQIYNDPARSRSAEWYIAAKGLFAAGLITSDPGASTETSETLSVADSQTDQQSL